MRPRRWHVPMVALVAVVGGSAGARADERAADLRTRALHLAYSLDYDEARRTLQDAIAVDPSDPAS